MASSCMLSTCRSRKFQLANLRILLDTYVKVVRISRTRNEGSQIYRLFAKSIKSQCREAIILLEHVKICINVPSADLTD